MKLGVCYYPEHWDESTWEPDAARMKELGIHFVRIGEFAWSRLEPTSGDYHFDWLDKAFNILGDAGLKVVLGTPTETPPKWLIDKYTDILPVGKDGHVRGFGSRRHYCYSSKSYQEETKRIVTVLAERYGKHEALAAWQTDNEYGCHDTVRCYCHNCRHAFRRWLAEKYGIISDLNKAWWNVFWSMEYTSFDEIELPNLTVTEANPSHSLDYYRFASDAVIAYNKLQVDILRKHSDKPVTHNVMLYFGNFDHYKLAKDLDTVTWDSYPLGMLDMSPLPEEAKSHYLRVGHPDLISFMHDLYYGLKEKPFWVMEQQPGQVNWAPNNPLPAKGAVKLWSHQAFAHGADVVSYFRWRAANGAQELMHAGLNLHDGTPDRAADEAKQVAEEIKPFADSYVPSADVCLLFDYENLWATELQPHSEGWNYWALQLSYYRALRSLGLNVAVRHPRQTLDAFKLVIAPALHLVDDSLASHLSAFVNKGGHLVIGPRSGFKTLSNTVQAPAPGPLSELMGVKILHVDGLRPGMTEQISLEGENLPYATWADILTPTTATVLAHYQTSAYENEAAVTRQLHNEGSCTTIGMWTEPEVLQKLLVPLLEQSLIPIRPLPEGIRMTERDKLTYLFNFNPASVPLNELGMEEMLEAHSSLILED